MNIFKKIMGYKKFDFSRILNRIMDISYLGIVFLVPVYFAFLFTNYNIFELNKTILFNVLTVLFLVCFLIKFLFYKELKIPERRGKYLLVPFLFLLVAVVSTVFSDFRELSLFGLYDRQQGLINLVYYFVFFVLLIFYIKDLAQIKRTLQVIGYSSFLVAIYGILQVLGLDRFHWMEDPGATGRAISSLGQPNYLGSFLLLVIPVVWYLFYTANNKTVKFWWMAVLLIQVVCLYFTLSRGAYLGLIVGVLVGLLVYFVFINNRRLKLSKKVVILSFITLFLLVVSSISIADHRSVQRLLQGFDFNRGSVAFRLDLWQEAVKAVPSAPFIGYGLDTQKEIFFEKYKKDWGVFANVNTVPSRAHNFILDKLLTIGFLGLFAYLVLLYFFIRLIFRLIKSEKQEDDHLNSNVFGLAILVSLVSYLTAAFFHFDIVATQVYFWLYLALVIVVYSIHKEKSGKRCFFFDSIIPFFKDRKAKHIKTLFIFKILVALILVVGFGFYFKKQIDHLVADHYYAYMKKAHIRQDYFRIFELYSHIKQLNIKEKHYDREAVLMISEFINNHDSETYKKLGFGKINTPLKDVRVSSRFRDIYAGAEVDAALAKEDYPDYFRKAEEKFLLLIEKSPKRPRVYISYAKMLTKEDRYKEAFANYDKAFGLLPSLDDPRLNKKHAQAIKKEIYSIEKGRAEVYFAQERYKKAGEHYRQALKNNFSDIALYKKIADTYYMRGETEKAIDYNKKGLLLNKRDPAWPFSIALLYKESGDEERALIYAKQALKISPKDKKVKNFINGL